MHYMANKGAIVVITLDELHRLIDIRVEQTLKGHKASHLCEVGKVIFSTREAAGYLGISLSYLYKLTSAHEIPYYKPRGKLCYFTKKDLDAFMCQLRVPSIRELNSE